MQTIVVGLDGSEGSERALDYAIVLAARGAHRLLLLTVVPHSRHAFMSLQDLTHNESWRKEQIHRGEETLLAPALKRAREAGATADGEVAFGNPPEVLAAAAREHGADSIIVGRRGLSGVQALVFGSVAGNLVQLAPVPVTVVP